MFVDFFYYELLYGTSPFGTWLFPFCNHRTFANLCLETFLSTLVRFLMPVKYDQFLHSERRHPLILHFSAIYWTWQPPIRHLSSLALVSQSQIWSFIGFGGHKMLQVYNFFVLHQLLWIWYEVSQDMRPNYDHLYLFQEPCKFLHFPFSAGFLFSSNMSQ